MPQTNCKSNLISICTLVLTLIMACAFSPQFSSAETVEELNEKIESYADKIKAIEREIEEQRKLINTTSAKAGEIQGQINTLNATKKKLQSDISRTQNVIKQSELTIKKIDIEVADKQEEIVTSQKGLAASMRSLNRFSEVPLIEMMLDSESISDFMMQVAQVQEFKEALIDKKYALLNLNRELEQKKNEEQRTKDELEKERLLLAGQHDTVASTQSAQSSLLAATKGEQARYEAILREKERQHEEFEALVRDIESQIKILIDPASFPDAGNGVLVWPLDNIIVTQQFGGSDFAAQNPGIYGRPYHPGTDFGTPVGSKVKSVSGGTVRGSGNTDAFPGCYAWGKWILVDHDNGLSSLYAHLSSVLVSSGQRVEAGEVIALSGNTGVSTGPHLHLTLYASQGVKIGQYGTYKPGGAGCAATAATGPFADLDAYLDPMTYLPSL